MFPREVVRLPHGFRQAKGPPDLLPWTASRCCRWRRKAASTNCRCARTLSSASWAYGREPRLRTSRRVNEWFWLNRFSSATRGRRFALGSLPQPAVASCTTAWTRNAEHGANGSAERTISASLRSARRLDITLRWPGGSPGPPRCRRRQAGVGRTDSRAWGHAHEGPERDEHAGQARQRPPAPDGFPEEAALERGQGLPKVG